MKYRIELVWNREFHWCTFKHEDDLKTAKKLADQMVESGDGARVKKIRVIDIENDKVVYNR